MKLTDTAVHAVLTNLRAEILASRTAPVPDTDPARVTDIISTVVRDVCTGQPAPAAVGISLGGQSIDHQVVNRAPFLHWTDVPLQPWCARRPASPP